MRWYSSKDGENVNSFEIHPCLYFHMQFPEPPGGPSQLESRQLQSGRQQEPCERQPLVFNLDQSSEGSVATQDVPDEFFKVTLDDVRKMMADQQIQA